MAAYYVYSVVHIQHVFYQIEKKTHTIETTIIISDIYISFWDGILGNDWCNDGQGVIIISVLQ